MFTVNAKPNKEGYYRVFAVPYGDKMAVGKTKLTDKSIDETTILTIIFPDNTTTEVFAGDIKFDNYEYSKN